jgi:hypothetical protein
MAAKVSPFDVAEATTSRSKRIDRSGSDKTTGFEATVRFEGHSYMLNEGDRKPRYARGKAPQKSSELEVYLTNA